MDFIKEWLNSGRNYAEGVKIYLTYGKEQKFINLFNEPIQTAFKEKKLAEVLTQLYKGNAKAVTVKATTTTKYLTGHKTWPEDTSDAILTALRNQWRPLYGERSSLQARLHDVALAGNTDSVKRQEAAQMAGRIIQLSKEISDIYATRSYYQQHGQLPQKQVEASPFGDAAKAYIAKKNAERYLREYTSKLKSTRGTTKQRIKWVQAIERHTKYLKQANNYLNRPENEGTPVPKNVTTLPSEG